MKALYTNEKEHENLTVNESELKTYDYDSRWQALKDGFKYVHLFESYIDNNEKKAIKYYSTMKMFI